MIWRFAAAVAALLSFRGSDGRWHELWNSARAPVTWERAPLLASVTWRNGASGIQWSEVELRGSGEAWRTRLVVARIDPARLTFALDTAFTIQREAAWTLAHVRGDAVLAINAGQFEATMPWGWVAIDGRRWLPPQRGPLSAALALDSSSGLRWIHGDSVAQFASRGGVRWAFQSYPVLLVNDSVPLPLRVAGSGVDLDHRDARAAVCLARDGMLTVALTRFDVAGSALSRIPFGLTVPEMAGIMGALGCGNAMLLDGGISARLRVRDAHGVAHDWEGLRPVPLGLVAFPRR